MAEIKASKLDAYSDIESEPKKGNDKGKKIIDAEPNAIIATTKIQKEEPEDSEKHLVLKYRSCLHIYIQEEMEFLDISSLGTTYWYASKIQQKIK